MIKEIFEFKPDEWRTPNTYDTNYAYPTTNSGVYLLVVPTFDIPNKHVDYSIKYVGSAKNLKVRYDRHEVRRFLQNIFTYVHFYFKEEPNYREVEKKLIKIIQPEYNRQWR